MRRVLKKLVIENAIKAVLIVFLSVFLFNSVSFAKRTRTQFATGSSSMRSSVKVKGYTKKNGTYVQPHRRTKKNKSKNDNWTHKGNVNPYTGKIGTQND